MSVPVRDGARGALAHAAAGELAAALLPRARSPLSGLGQAFIDALPGPSVDAVIATAATRDKALLRANLAALTLGAGLAGRRALAVLGLAGGAAAARRPENAAGASLAAGAAAALAGATRPPAAVAALALAAAAATRQRQRERAEDRRSATPLPRARRPLPPVRADAELRVAGLTRLFTPNDAFYVTDAALTAPRVDADRWRLRLRGLVDRDLALSLDDLLALDAVEVDATLVCVHNPVGGDRIGSARWLGVPLRALLDRAGVRPPADQVLTHSVTGFTAGLPLSRADDALVALAMNGEPLTVRNGFPARLLTPGVWGADANTKWLETIELTTFAAARDYWDARGWPRIPGAVRPGARIDVPGDRDALVAGRAVAAGVAWAPASGGITRVEVSIDGGEWRAARLSPALAPTLWRQWMLAWTADPGEHELRVRAVAADGVQDERAAPPYPHGAGGYHAVRVAVVAGGALPARRRVRAAQTGAEARARVALAARAVPAWRRQGWPRTPRFAAP